MANSFLYFYLPIGSIFALYWLTKLLSIILTQCQRKNTMPTTNQVMLTNIQKFSETLSEPQLNKFLDIVDCLGELLVLANEDTEKAYQMYLNSLEVQVNGHSNVANPLVNLNTKNGAGNVVQFKH